MPIYWKRGDIIFQTHEDLVVEVEDFYVHVYNPNTLKVETVSTVISDYEGAVFSTAIEDVSDELREAILFRDKLDDVVYRISQVEKDGKDEILSIAIGKRVVVRRGRKIPYGVEGMVFFFGPGSYGDRVGIQTDDNKTYWTAATNVDVVLPGILPGQFPAEGWKKTQLALEQFTSNNSLNLLKGELVRNRNEPNVFGPVFWAKESRVGFGNSLYLNESELEVFRNDVWVGASTEQFPFQACESFMISSYQMEHLPSPYNEIEYLEIASDGSAKAFTHEGDFLLTFSPEDAYKYWLVEEALQVMEDAKSLGQ